MLALDREWPGQSGPIAYSGVSCTLDSALCLVHCLALGVLKDFVLQTGLILLLVFSSRSSQHVCDQLKTASHDKQVQVCFLAQTLLYQPKAVQCLDFVYRIRKVSFQHWPHSSLVYRVGWFDKNSYNFLQHLSKHALKFVHTLSKVKICQNLQRISPQGYSFIESRCPCMDMSPFTTVSKFFLSYYGHCKL